MQQPRGPALLLRFLDSTDIEAADLVRAALAGWLADGPDSPAGLLARLGLSGTRASVLRGIRDYNLIAASAEIGGSHRELHQACKLFSRVWPVWRRLPGPPTAANNVERLLHRAFAANDAAGALRNALPHGPGDWSPSAFRKLLCGVHTSCQKSARAPVDSVVTHHPVTKGRTQNVETVA